MRVHACVYLGDGDRTVLYLDWAGGDTNALSKLRPIHQKDCILLYVKTVFKTFQIKEAKL